MRIYPSKRKAWAPELTGHHKPWTPDEEGQLIFHRECGLNRREIAELHGRTHNGIGTHICIMRRAGRL